MERGSAIVLIGFMGAGKSSVGLELSRLTDLPLYETDEAVAAEAGMAVQDFFEAHGEAFFRDAESAALRGMPSDGAIVSTGGGIVVRPENLELLQRLGFIVYLEADEAALVSRLRDDTERRPLLRDDDISATVARLLREREPLYRTLADLTINTVHLQPDEIAQKITQYVG